MLDSLCLALSQYFAFEEYRTAKVTDLVKDIKFGKCFGEINKLLKVWPSDPNPSHQHRNEAKAPF